MSAPHACVQVATPADALRGILGPVMTVEVGAAPAAPWRASLRAARIGGPPGRALHLAPGPSLGRPAVSCRRRRTGLRPPYVAALSTPCLLCCAALCPLQVGQQLDVVFRNLLPFRANLMLDGGLELLPAAGTTFNPEAPVEPNATISQRYYVPERCAPPLPCPAQPDWPRPGPARGAHNCVALPGAPPPTPTPTPGYTARG